MADPIVFDCGGSTRIKRVLEDGFGDMPKLLDIHNLTDAQGQPLPNAVLSGTGPLPPAATGSQDLVKHVTNKPFAKVTIMFQDAQGVPFTIPVAQLPSSFVIASNLGQNVRGDFVPGEGGRDLIITIFSIVSDPLVTAKQLRLDAAPNRNRRRYIVDNAGPFKTITLDGNVVYDATDVEGHPAKPGPPSILAAPRKAPQTLGAVGPAGRGAPAPGLPLYVSVVIS